MRKLFLGQEELIKSSSGLVSLYSVFRSDQTAESDGFQTTEEIQKKKQAVFIYSGELEFYLVKAARPKTFSKIKSDKWS